ncbi:unnamed protein product [Phytophthora lilii]|uniref:Unnamed protein product n=1 Tax=Phytophthora lilii TaxID=2077276 RepID=A0A9W6TYX1_9STRA|nr:unnamed protein product [Phytophthora lilii]
MKLSDAIEQIRGFAEEELFQERLQEMQQDCSDCMSDIGLKEKLHPKARIGSIRALVKMKSLGRSIPARKGDVTLVVAAA